MGKQFACDACKKGYSQHKRWYTLGILHAITPNGAPISIKTAICQECWTSTQELGDQKKVRQFIIESILHRMRKNKTSL